MPSDTQDQAIVALAAIGRNAQQIATAVGVEIGDVESVLGGGTFDPPGVPLSGGSGGSMLPTPDLSVGTLGFFGGEITNPKTKPSATPDWSPAFDRAWTRDSGSPSAIAVDNAYMAWDPNADATSILIKQDGWYSVWYAFGFTSPLAELENFGVDVGLGGQFGGGGQFAGSTDFDIPVGGGASGFNYSGVLLSYLTRQGALPGSLGMSIVLAFHNSLSSPAELSFGWLFFFPLFALA